LADPEVHSLGFTPSVPVPRFAARPRLATLALLAVGLTASCTAPDYSRRAGHSADRILEKRDADVLGTREAEVRYPEEMPPPPAPEAGAEGEAGEGAEPAPTTPPEPGAEDVAQARRVIDLRQALGIAYQSSRDLIDQRENLHLTALGLSGVRHGYSPQLGLILSYEFDEAPDSAEQGFGVAALSASQILPTGGNLSVGLSGSTSASEGVDPDYASGLSVRLVQPLLRNAGHAVSHEFLIQAERNLVYAIRSFELFREDFSIDVARRYYDLVGQKQRIDNQRRSLESSQFGLRQAEALFAVGRQSELDVLRERRSELSARNDYLAAQENYQAALDDFRIFLGLPPESAIDVSPEPPPFVPVTYDRDSALAVAQENRLDLLSRREQVEDSERALNIARNGLLPDLDLDVSTGAFADSPDRIGDGTSHRSDTRVGLTLGLPVDRVNERNSYRSAQISLGRARRDLEEFEDRVRIDIQASFRELERRLESLEINRTQIQDQTKTLRIAEIRFERGEIPNRDVVEARESLLAAQNDLINEQVNYEISRLRLLRNLGILFVDQTGMWQQ